MSGAEFSLGDGGRADRLGFMLASFTAAMALALLSSAMQPVNTVDGRYHLPENMLAAQGEEPVNQPTPDSGTTPR